MKDFIPKDFQAPFSEQDFIIEGNQQPGEDSIELDVLFIGAGPASLTGAIHLAQLAKSKKQNIEIGIMEKADEVGGHTLSGAVINPLVFKWLFPDKADKDFPFRKKVKKESFYLLSEQKTFPLPVPPGMKAKGCWTASLCEVARFLAKSAQELGVNIFTSFPAEKLLMNEGKVVGAISKAYGLNKDGTKTDNAEPASKIFAKVVVLSEGSRGHLTQAYLQNQNITSHYPQTYALGVKEIWEVKKEPDNIFHSIAWPLDSKTFGGSWFYPLGEGLVSLGLVVGLDYPSAQLSIHDKFQKMKDHFLFKKYLEGGKCIEWGAKTIPEGGYHAIPNRLSGDGVLIIGDSAGFVNMASLKGIHYAMASGYYSAETIMSAFDKKDFSHSSLKEYDQKIKNSFIAKDLYIYRNLRQSFHKGLFSGLIKAGLITLTRGYLPFDFKKSQLQEDSKIKRQVNSSHFSENERMSKVNAVYLSGNKTRDKIPSHLIQKAGIKKDIALFYEKMCPAGVYEQKGDQLIVNAPNCIDCKATDILGPRWTPRERGSGPNYKIM
ncbi:MAG: electron-transfer flavoprotein:ubiquinone oxidoreductase [Bdellovibrionaceae bacterium]|nr:electron-transfer flavoprotein:ubiquinone oxidoreductase [Pseudobdellovibrionaceae bacterium]